MIQIVRKITADVVKRGSTRAVYAKQKDVNTRFLNVQIQEDGTDIQVDSIYEVVLNVERPDKQENMFYGTVNEDGTVKIPLTSWMLELEGTLLCDISIVYEGAAKLTTMQFNIYVEEAVITDEAIVETEEYSVIVDLLARTSASAEIAAQAAQDALILKENCEEATQRANEAAEVAEDLVDGHIHRIVEKNKGVAITLWVGTTEEFDALESKENNCFYIKTDETKQPEVLWEGSVTEADALFEVPGINKYQFFEIEISNPNLSGHSANVFAYKRTNQYGYNYIEGSFVGYNDTFTFMLSVNPDEETVMVASGTIFENFNATDKTVACIEKITGIM